MGLQMPLNSQQKAHVMGYMRLKVDEVEWHLNADDIDGANDLMDAVAKDAGRGVHDLVLDAIAKRRGQTGWRTFVPREPD